MTRYPPEPPGREEVVTILAKLGDRTPDAVTEQIGSLEVAWLISEVEQQYQVTLEPQRRGTSPDGDDFGCGRDARRPAVGCPRWLR